VPTLTPGSLMDSIVLQSVSKVFRHRPVLFNWLGTEQGGTTVALDKVSLSVPAGSILALLGPNGSGKTTLLKLISTMLLPDSGRVLVHGADTLIEPQRVRSCVGFAIASERSFFPRLTARENLDFFAALDDVPRKWRKLRIETTLARTGLHNAADTLVRKFSSGMYQRLAITRALIKQPSVLLLDEPTRSLDTESRQDFWRLVRKLAANGTAIVMATHNFEEAAAVGDCVAVLHHGQLTGHRQLDRVAPDEIRFFYSQTTGATGEVYTSESLIKSLQ
jgi:ABC-2 type transport system ATP-binding protein